MDFIRREYVFPLYAARCDSHRRFACGINNPASNFEQSFFYKIRDFYRHLMRHPRRDGLINEPAFAEPLQPERCGQWSRLAFCHQ